ncbi:hypothetical protein BK133_29140 [Paenibacillus sp. FSL H8-0548]|uniref:S-layer homology domain-containing protein n=1 Tax=Paenibacillus sp. FSL H8-0548 TaxID=1920422 RepID=UPI00096E1D82|nr:S-layer homology domain-containing protein [Paenibacillus sp. FSL H8-0548]OMF20475.1 hypothetical protein BK133_29140 [Paenibacillus sp. FSL H8-0548]
MTRFAFIAMIIIVFIAALSYPFTDSHSTIALAPSATSPVFKDIKGHWTEKTINNMENKVILNEYPDRTFRSQKSVKIDQFIKTLVLSHPSATKTFIYSITTKK